MKYGKSIYENYSIDGPIKNSAQKYYFIFKDRKILLIDNKIPLLNNLNEINIVDKNIKNNLYLGNFYDKDAYVIELSSEFELYDSNQLHEKFHEPPKILETKNSKILEDENKNPKILENDDSNTNQDNIINNKQTTKLNSKLKLDKVILTELQELYDIDEESYLIAGRAIQIIDWENNHQYCGRCGLKTYTSDIERAKVCPECGFMSFTRICPAIITTIIKEDVNENGEKVNSLLMAKHSYHKHHRYALIAGFMEAGETIEEAVAREIKEEIGIEVEDIEYFGSQSWPFPNSLMIGFVCKYKCGDIKVDGNEIVDAKWFKKEDIDEPKSYISISSKLIKNFIDNY